MRQIPLVLATLAACAALGVAGAGAGEKYKNARGGGCPPGLAKKSPACIPPGQAKKLYGSQIEHYPYRIGDRINDDFILIDRPGRYGLDPGATYYRLGDNVFRVNRQTREILDLVGAASALFN